MASKDARSYRTQAIVLSHIEYGEADRILKLFTLEKGKISAIAKGVRKIRSRKAGHLEPFTHVNLFLAKGRNLDIITQAETIDPFLGLRDNLERVAFASYVMELLDRFTYEEGQNVGLFRLLANTLSRLENQPNTETIVHYFELRFLDLLGFRPQLFECVECGKAIQEQDQYFSPLLGGVLCPKCGITRGDAWPVEKDTLRYFRHLQRSNWGQVASIIIPEDIEAKLADLITRYFTYLLERKLNSPTFLREVRGKYGKDNSQPLGGLGKK
jgi:DNA repair protein RecO (recombination protein O)